MATASYTSRSTVDSFNNTAGTFNISGTTTTGGPFEIDNETTVPTHPPTYEDKLYCS